MKHLIALLLLLPFCSSAFAQEPSISDDDNVTSKPLAYVYAGTGACAGCAEALMHTLRLSGFRAKKIVPGQFTEERLAEASVVAIPGGDDTIQAKLSFYPGEIEVIQNYVREGGHYLGVCLGAYLAGKDILNLIPEIVSGHSETEEARMEQVEWLGEKRWVYFQDGPEFKPSSAEKIWSHYADGSVAALQTSFGKGKVGLIGPHLEANQKWLKEDQLEDLDGPDYDLFIEFMQELVK